MAGKPQSLTRKDHEFIAKVPEFLREAYRCRRRHTEIAKDFQVSENTARGWLYKNGSFPIYRKQEFIQIVTARLDLETEKSNKLKPQLVQVILSALQSQRLAGSDPLPLIVHPREVAKITAAYETDPEILLACIIVSGTLDTAQILKTECVLKYPDLITAADRVAFHAFRRVWRFPTEHERAAFVKWAERIAKQSRRPHRGRFRWTVTELAEPKAHSQ